MNKEEAKQKLHNLAFAKLDTKPDDLKLADVMQIVNQIDEPQAGQAEEAPRYVKNILARLRELPLHDREVWLKAIMGEFEKDFSHAKWREGHEVEKEKRYIVKVKGVEESHKYLNHRISLDSWFFSGESEPLDFSVKHTRKELEEAGFEEVFNSPLFEVKEVEG
nr:MAG TPA: Protein of unknown function (DUF1642) [Caudoviricetes sp.]